MYQYTIFNLKVINQRSTKDVEICCHINVFWEMFRESWWSQFFRIPGENYSGGFRPPSGVSLPMWYWYANVAVTGTTIFIPSPLLAEGGGTISLDFCDKGVGSKILGLGWGS